MQNEGTKLIDMLYDKPIFPMSEIYYAYSALNSDDISIKMIYKISQNSDIIFDEFGTFYLNGTFDDKRSTSNIIQSRQYLTGHEFKASMVITNNDSLNHLSDYR